MWRKYLLSLAVLRAASAAKSQPTAAAGIPVAAPVLGIDFGSETFTAVAVSPQVFLDVVLNSQSKRKTQTAVSFAHIETKFTDRRLYGDDAASLLRQAVLGKSFPTFVEDWTSLSYLLTPPKSETEAPFPQVPQLRMNMTFNELRHGSPQWSNLSAQIAQPLSGEEILAQLVDETISMATDHEGSPGTVSNRRSGAMVSLAVPYAVDYRTRQALKQAVEIAGAVPVALVQAPLAAAVAHSMDIVKDNLYTEKQNKAGAGGEPGDKPGVKLPITKVFLDAGAAHVEGCRIRFESVEAAVCGKAQCDKKVMAFPEACSGNSKVGSRQIERAFAARLETLAGRDPKTISAVEHLKFLRAAEKAKLQLSANREVFVSVEGGRGPEQDFRMSVERAELLEAVKSSAFSDVVMATLDSLLTDASGARIDAVKTVEMLGGGLRLPSVQEAVLSQFPGIELAQHCNAEEAVATGAALVGANMSGIYRVGPFGMHSAFAEQKIDFQVFDDQGILQSGVLVEDVNSLTLTDRSSGLSNLKMVIDLTTEGISLASSPSSSQNTNTSENQTDASSLASHLKVMLLHKSRVLESYLLDPRVLIRRSLKAESELRKTSRSEYESATTNRSTWISLNETVKLTPQVELKFAVSPLGLVSLESATAMWKDYEVTLRKIKIPATLAATLTANGNKTDSGTDNDTDSGTDKDSEMSTTTTTSEPLRIYSEIPINKTRNVPVHSNLRSLTSIKSLNLLYPLPLTETEIDSAKTRLKDFRMMDMKYKMLMSKRNDLESNLYKLRSLVDQSKELGLIETSELKRLQKLNVETEEFLEEDAENGNYSKVLNKFEQIQTPLNLLREKLYEYQNRDSIINKSKKDILNLKQKYNDTNSFTLISEFEKWFEQKITEQKKIKKTDSPILISSIVEERYEKLTEKLLTSSKPKKIRITTVAPTDKTESSKDGYDEL